MSAEQNKAVVRRFYEAFAINDRETLDQIVAPDMVAHSMAVHGRQNREEMLQGIAFWNATFSDTHVDIQEQFAEGDTVVTRYIFHTTHDKADFQGVAPTGKSCESPGVSIERIKDGQIVERYLYGDRSSMFEQLGLAPSAQSAE